MKHSKQYTIRGISEALDKKLRQVANKKSRSLNAWVLEILNRHAGLDEEGVTYHDLDHLAGKWKEDHDMLKALTEQRKIDEELWK
ncbi:MAG TPA: antitoxin [Bdellovibrionota bacterium]|nr:antitoxin [Bdellovibrionota bacterium]